ncbi:GvpL/GvpF family gas vesicle protein [Nocardioides sp. NPDC057577]|uniref:GvpL/GvpF family gas vesicle protein n=1 Tax=Nocardioides sp. NPDC057577 TaxID=3346171 RepID=UPI0036702735
MMLLYAVATAAAGSTGEMVDPPLQAHRSRGLTVFVEPRAEAPERSTRELLGFGRVLHQLWSYVPVLPLRFGAVVSDTDELDQLVAERESEWTDRIAAVTGHSECIVHLPLPERVPERVKDEQTGSDYLRRRAAELKQHDAETAELRTLLAPYASELTTLPSVRPQVARLSVLLPDERVEDAREAVRDWATSRHEVMVTGPWPPFSFCQEVST